ncbi:MAG: hypothetical protein HQK49_06900 [Oligoflexia bacterium]|nr:hypothetical protein [Oligoflexia bacterium]
MNCIQCNRPAHGVCKFCGRAICKDHFTTSNIIMDIYPRKNDQEKDRVLVVENVLKCSYCKPIENLLEIDIKI